jgi:hypothetical protein
VGKFQRYQSSGLGRAIVSKRVWRFWGPDRSMTLAPCCRISSPFKTGTEAGTRIAFPTVAHSGVAFSSTRPAFPSFSLLNSRNKMRVCGRGEPSATMLKVTLSKSPPARIAPYNRQLDPVQRAYRRRPHAGTYIEASTTKRPTIKQTTALVTSEAHGQPSAQDSSHRVCMWQPPLL